jgi:hypothetical protein
LFPLKNQTQNWVPNWAPKWVPKWVPNCVPNWVLDLYLEPELEVLQEKGKRRKESCPTLWYIKKIPAFCDDVKSVE